VKAVRDTHATVEELLEAVFSVRPVSRLYNDQLPLTVQQVEAIQNHENIDVRDIGKVEARQRKYKRLKLGVGEAYDRSSY
jgi:hypothetical protein